MLFGISVLVRLPQLAKRWRRQLVNPAVLFQLLEFLEDRPLLGRLLSLSWGPTQ